jgi:hypothetical protein
LEECYGTLLRTNLFDGLGKLNNGDNQMESKLWKYQVSGKKCTYWFKSITTTSGHLPHLTSSEEIGKVNLNQQVDKLSIVPTSSFEEN